MKVHLAVTFIAIMAFGVAAQTVETARDDEVCALPLRTVIKVSVSVWNATAKSYLNDLDYKSFEILEGKDAHPIEFFIKPGYGDDLNLKDQYILGFSPVTGPDNKWHEIRIRLKPSVGKKSLIIRASKGYFY